MLHVQQLKNPIPCKDKIISGTDALPWYLHRDDTFDPAWIRLQNHNTVREKNRFFNIMCYKAEPPSFPPQAVSSSSAASSSAVSLMESLIMITSSIPA